MKHVSKDAEFYEESSSVFATSAALLLKTILRFFYSVFDCRSWTIEWVLIISIYRRQKNLIEKVKRTVL